MVLDVAGSPGLVLRPLAAADVADLLRIHAEPEVERWWGPPEAGFPLSDDPEPQRLTIELDGRVAGLIQFYEEPHERFRSAAVDVFLDPVLRGRGLGTEALRRLVRHLVEDRGHHRITIDPAVANEAAIRSYEKAGFARVGVMRAYERVPGAEGGHVAAGGRSRTGTGASGWRDALLMELVVT